MVEKVRSGVRNGLGGRVRIETHCREGANDDVGSIVCAIVLVLVADKEKEEKRRRKASVRS